MKRRHCIALLSLPLLVLGAATASGPGGASRPPVGPARAEPADAFIEALLRHPEKRVETLRRLTEAALTPDPKPRDVLFLALNHLWIVAEGEPDAVTRFQHGVLAVHWFDRAAVLLPEDDRISGWRNAAAWGVAQVEGRREASDAALEKLADLALQDPCFHSVALGIASFGFPRGSEEFKRAHAAMEAAFECKGDNPSIEDRPHWPHNVHGFLVALADYRLKSGDIRGAESALVIAEAREGFDRWPFRGMVEKRMTDLREHAALFANDDPEDDPAFVFAPAGPASCRACHGASQR